MKDLRKKTERIEKEMTERTGLSVEEAMRATEEGKDLEREGRDLLLENIKEGLSEEKRIKAVDFCENAPFSMVVKALLQITING